MSSKTNRSSVSSMDGHMHGLEESEIYLRKRIRDRSPEEESLEAGELSDGLSEDEDIPGCPLPSTPEDTELLEAEVRKDFTIFSIKKKLVSYQFTFVNLNLSND